ncbi:TetR/AcrR family transcriptional regulator [Kibdelosporangium phytohabitans]|uniref:TetR/AcrR family transcriptional regulator n=1 Tax=Kibdelosporangium phytohabitans TaxID=860235 RepID=UPI000B11E318|nr:TetR/AcrR family transcriptional regulator [Kibdelosporangium phytohabitans]MBE1469902.1 AcrR family transcriptional regulator [Kibdelosporangium phytohabitans]
MLTRKGLATRQRIVEATSALVREHGTAATTLDDVRARTATSKSQIFHYFPGGKEELLLAVAEYETDRVLLDQEPYLSELTSWQAWQNWRDLVVRRYREAGVHCPLGVLITELGRKTPAAQALTGRLLERWQDRLRVGVEHMQLSGEIDPGLDADRVAASLIAAVQGGVTVLLSTGGIGHLEAALDTSLALLRATGVTPRWRDPESDVASMG